MDDENEALPAPYELGECVEFLGPHAWQKGSGPQVRPGDIGVVVEVEAPGENGDDEHDPEHGRCAVEFHGSKSAWQWIRARSGSRDHPEYRRVDCPGLGLLTHDD